MRGCDLADLLGLFSLKNMLFSMKTCLRLRDHRSHARMEIAGRCDQHASMSFLSSQLRILKNVSGLARWSHSFLEVRRVNIAGGNASPCGIVVKTSAGCSPAFPCR